MFGFPGSGTDSLGMYALLTYGFTLLVAAVCCVPAAGAFLERLRTSGKPGKIVWSAGFLVLFVLSIAFLVDNSYNPFQMCIRDSAQAFSGAHARLTLTAVRWRRRFPERTAEGRRASEASNNHILFVGFLLASIIHLARLLYP